MGQVKFVASVRRSGRCVGRSGPSLARRGKVCGRSTALAMLLLEWSTARPAHAALPPAVAMVANANNGSVTVFDMNTDTVLGSVSIGGEMLDWSLDGAGERQL